MKRGIKTLMIDSIAFGDVDAIAKLIRKEPQLLALEMDRRRTPLHRAAECSQAGVVRLLLDLGADPNALDLAGMPPIWHAINFSESTAVTQIFLEQGVDANFALDNYSLLHLSASKDDSEPFVRLLLQWGATPNVLNSNGRTPIADAARKGHRETVKILLSAGADPLLKNSHALDALQLAKKFNRDDIVADIEAFCASRSAQQIVSSIASTPHLADIKPLGFHRAA